MKKLIGVLLALMIAVTGFAFAEGSARLTEKADGYLLVQIENDAGRTLALIGSGDGKDAFDAFAPEDGGYSERFAGFWKVLSMLRPALSLEGSIENMSFEPALNNTAAVVMLNGVEVAQIDGREVFAIVSGKELPTFRQECKVNIWAEAGVTGSVCPNCGEVDDGSSKHDDVISVFCDEKHTLCMGDPEHHCDVCGKDYVCSKSGSHTECIVCGKAWCDKSEGDHATLECGHRGCEIYGNEDAHALCEICGEYVCSEEHTEHPDTEEDADGEIPDGDVVVEA